jgi:hypothetical protein
VSYALVGPILRSLRRRREVAEVSLYEPGIKVLSDLPGEELPACGGGFLKLGLVVREEPLTRG